MTTAYGDLMVELMAELGTILFRATDHIVLPALFWRLHTMVVTMAKEANADHYTAGVFSGGRWAPPTCSCTKVC